MALHRNAALREQVIREKLEFAGCSNLRIENANGASRSVARIGKVLAAGGVLLAIQFLEGGARHHGFTANFNIVRQAKLLESFALEAQRDGANGADIRSDVFAGLAIASRDAANEHSIFINQRKTEAVEFVLGDVFDFVVASEFANAAIKIL